ncbi:hypothetical protein TPB0596_14930 [Tsukamurella pulmonis]|uniref:Uncharacterized protein n=1 Tax=Tsukamurella pulmonis TaxID=47312 RepID=A0A1H1GLE9_9ACTN|nr:B-4DMT family transporter [Tsukamurella pulmonis]KXO88579.1 hypothetical protein AXK56_11555 [Tsukamurella pulmonis]RDH13062.1 hypothetical protein DVB88_04350 [Tsukamurella pulmonis]SDR13957.1 hypothetical protein SAMN04489765_3411 [Tsukamurella pulmonis]SUP17087.1 Uncharacterised protein [Tsukamurella pulmonis]BDD81730.1 hypothetical protein TPB0596_14930 [Tsukamurella pulmonis]
MKPWLIRGIALAAVQVVVRSALAWGIVAFPTHGTAQRFTAVAVVVAVAIVFGGYDGLTDARRYPVSEQGIDLVGRWFKAGLFAGVVSGAVCWVLGTWLLPGIGQGSLPFELVVGACFTALLIVIPASLGTVVGRRLAAKRPAPA